MRDYYKILGVDRNISQKNLKKQYYKLARKFHPDTVEMEKRNEVERIFKDITEAYNALSSKDKRRRYDMGGMRGNIVYSNGFSSSVSKKAIILNKLKKKKDFSIISFATELMVNHNNLEKILIKFISLNKIQAKIITGRVIYY